MKIRIAEIFESISGEVGDIPQGSPTTFVRLAGCSLGCPFCDTKTWQDPNSGFKEEVEIVANMIKIFPWKNILITGGEPLEQKEAVTELTRILYEKKPHYFIQVETNGTIPISTPWKADCWVVDCKGKDAMNGIPYEFNPGFLHSVMWVKYLVGSKSDLDDAIRMARVVLRRKRESTSSEFLHAPRFAISPLVGKVSHQEVQEAILKSRLPIVLNVQLHKNIGVR